MRSPVAYPAGSLVRALRQGRRGLRLPCLSRMFKGEAGVRVRLRHLR